MNEEPIKNVIDNIDLSEKALLWSFFNECEDKAIEFINMKFDILKNQTKQQNKENFKI